MSFRSWHGIREGETNHAWVYAPSVSGSGEGFPHLASPEERDGTFNPPEPWGIVLPQANTRSAPAKPPHWPLPEENYYFVTTFPGRCLGYFFRAVGAKNHLVVEYPLKVSLQGFLIFIMGYL